MKNDVGKSIVDILISEEGRDKKIVFLPYKIEMWDSMESIYTECINNGLNAKIHPVEYTVYMDTHSRYTTKDTWFDSENKITYREFLDFNPDIIIFHYPFDDYNRVTAMPTKYLSHNLKKQGRKLVYVPYHGSWILQKEMMLPAVLSSDYMFVSSEDIKSYCESIWRIQRVNFCPKVFATGTPKSDKIYRSGLSNCNTLISNSLIPFLDDTNRVYKYMKIARQEMDDGRNVIFRPHPLLHQTLSAMRAERLAEYERFLEWLKREGAIIDTNINFEDTVSNCCKIYCDGGSILDICSKAGIAIQLIH